MKKAKKAAASGTSSKVKLCREDRQDISSIVRMYFEISKNFNEAVYLITCWLRRYFFGAAREEDFRFAGIVEPRQFRSLMEAA